MQKIARKFNLVNEKALLLFVVVMTATNADAAIRALPGDVPTDGWMPRLFSRVFEFAAGLFGQVIASGVIDIPPGCK